MKLLLDTSHLMPAIGVSVRHLPQALVSDLRSRGHSVSISTITILELAAKGAKLVDDGKLKGDRVMEGIQAILNDPSINRVDFQQSNILRRATAARSKIRDFFDCLILSTAATHADALVSEDEQIKKAVFDRIFLRELQPINAAFTVYPSRDIP